MIRILPCFFLLACGAELPPTEGTVSAAALSAPAPQLVPLDDLLVPASQPVRAADAGATLQRRGAGLAARGIAPPTGGDLAARGAALRARAETLRAAPLD
ncbi:MAG: hypothetical protein AAF919_08625 [Pseudomonadota bacterium]